MQAPQGLGPTDAKAAVVRLLPPKVEDKAGWAADLHAALATLGLPSTPAHLCAVMAVTEQESGWQVDPVVPKLGAIARQEIDRRADAAGVPAFAVRAALALSSSDGRSYAQRLETVRTEGQLSALYEDFIDRVPLGRSFLASRNPVRTGGPMQVSIAFAQAQVQARPYPYPLADGVRHEVFTRRGGLYFGAAHLLDYPAPYGQMIYRFADFNAGRWASRNAGFQAAVALASGLPVALDGDLLPPAGSAAPGETERAVATLAERLGLDAGQVRRDLARGDGSDFERTPLYERVFAYAEQLERRALPRAVLPRIDPRALTTEWFARRVDERHRRCLDRFPDPAAG
ncbi:DUF1615 domain-containing protein [Piscinibacter sakaiensis]|uniref:DUF1615 domain-containing protein n=1 Tax=Piscinibacter sakaiensis TaxID=1547922 RepID=UPI0037292E6A